MSLAYRFLVPIAIALTFSAVRLEAHGGGGGGGHGDPGFRGGAHDSSPEDEESTGHSSFFGDHNNEGPEQVDFLIEKTTTALQAARHDGSSESSRDLAQKLERLKIRRRIAEKRRQRDAFKQAGQPDRAAAIEREVHDLKSTLKQSASPRPAPSSTHEPHAGHE